MCRGQHQYKRDLRLFCWPTLSMTERMRIHMLAQESKMLCCWFSNIYKQTHLLSNFVKTDQAYRGFYWFGKVQEAALQWTFVWVIPFCWALCCTSSFLTESLKERKGTLSGRRLHCIYSQVLSSTMHCPQLKSFWYHITRNSTLACMFTPNIQMFISRYHAHF